MANAYPDDMFSFCKVCKKKTTGSTIMKHIEKSKDSSHERYKNSEEYMVLDNAIKKLRKEKKKENNKRYKAMTKDQRHQNYISERSKRLEYRHQYYSAHKSEELANAQKYREANRDDLEKKEAESSV